MVIVLVTVTMCCVVLCCVLGGNGDGNDVLCCVAGVLGGGNGDAGGDGIGGNGDSNDVLCFRCVRGWTSGFTRRPSRGTWTRRCGYWTPAESTSTVLTV